MAKNLKLKIKNAQLASALNLKPKQKKAAEPKKKAPEKEEKKPAKSEGTTISRIIKDPYAPEEEKKEEEQVQAAPEPIETPLVETPPPPVEEAETPPPPPPPVEAKEVETKEEPAPKKEKPKAEPKKAEKPPASKPPRKPGGFREFKDLKPQRKGMGMRAFDSRDKQGLRDHDSERWRKQKAHQKKKLTPVEEIIRPKEITVRVPITIKDLASTMKLKASELIAKLFLQGMAVTLNDFLEDETTIQLLGHEFECEIHIDTSEEKRLQITDKTIQEEVAQSPPEKLSNRPPIITFMGHVDHGKTSLIDSIRKANVAAGESGAITQHIGAFKCHTPVGDLTILDTPGHEAFSAMRSRGANITDVVALVIAGDEGIRAQTIEAIEQAKNANVPILVVLNKCDKPEFNADNVYRQLADQNLLPEAWGGEIVTVNCSAATGEGIEQLLEMLALQSEMLELRANPSYRARGIVIESQLHKGMGAVATLIVQNGTLSHGDAIVFDEHWARVKTMENESGKKVQTAGPSTPVKITGLSGIPNAGSEFIVVASEKEARDIANARSIGQKQKKQARGRAVESIFAKHAEEKEVKTLHLVLRADVQGSLEALKNSLLKIKSKKVQVNIISEGVGEISESDIQLSAASKAPIIGFHTQIESHAEPLIKQLQASVSLYDIIYHAVEGVKELMLDLLDKIPEENTRGTAEVKATFKSSHLGVIAGCQVTDGTINRNHLMRLIRDGEQIWKGSIASLKRVKEDVREVSKGYECGILLQNNNDVREGDILESYDITYLTQDL